MANIKLILEYDGTEFHGFQRQSKLRTVQGELEACFSRLLGETIRVTGAGRTDAGVHALGQVVNFRTSRPVGAERMTSALNGSLPADVKVQQCEDAAEDFHARRCARSRTYRYTIVRRAVPSPVQGRYALVTADRLDVEKMRTAARPLLGRHDFRAFQASGSETRTTERSLSRLECRQRGAVVEITAEADSFLYRMVRIMVAGLIEVGRGSAPGDTLEGALRSKERPPGLAPAPACGLCLVKVSYSEVSGRGVCSAGCSDDAAAIH